MNRYPSARVDDDYGQDVVEYRQLFAVVDRTDLASLRQWLTDHPYLVTNDHCIISGASIRTVQRWYRMAGVARPKREPPKRRQLPRYVPTAPPDWQTSTWLEKHYGQYSIRALAQAISRSYTATRRLLLRRGVLLQSPREAVRSKHRCCNRDWVEQHYKVAGLSVTQCARIADVSSSTMSSWLLRFGIRVRSVGEQLALAARLKKSRSISPWWGSMRRTESGLEK